MRLLDRLESRFGRLAIPGLIQAIAVLQLFTLVIFMVLPLESRQPYEDLLRLHPRLVMEGQVWRLISYVFIPSSNVFFAFIAAMFMMWLGRGLEAAWGAFRVNLYIFGGMFSLALGALLFGYEASFAWLFLGVLFAFASIYPNEEILLFFVLPVKIKWVALFSAATLILSIISAPIFLIPALFALLNFGIVFGPAFVKSRIHSAKVANRRARFEGAAAPETYFHQCKVCGKTEVDDPKLDFRVTDSGDEICSNCRKLG
jgi:hypothetical protein